METKHKETKYRQTRKNSLNAIASMFGGMAGNAVKETRKKSMPKKKKKMGR